MTDLHPTLKNISALIFIVTTCGTLLVATFINTNPRFIKAVEELQEKKLLEILSPYTFTNRIISETIIPPKKIDAGINGSERAYLGKHNQEIVAILLPITVKDGYSGKIKILIGISSGLEILGIKILSHNETPGLGDRIDPSKSNWILAFKGRSLKTTDPRAWKVKKDGGDFDQFTGATITPRSIVIAIRKALVYVEDNYELFFNSH